MRFDFVARMLVVMVGFVIVVRVVAMTVNMGMLVGMPVNKVSMSVLVTVNVPVFMFVHLVMPVRFR
jgi:hypothetical protein